MAASALGDLREAVWRANLELVRSGLVTLSFGNASGIDRASGIMVIKPSGVPYVDLQPADMVAVALDDGRVVDGGLRPSSDSPTHLALYRRYADIGGVVHTHSPAATAWAQACRAIPPLGTTHADHFHGAIPVTRQLSDAEVAGSYEAETGAVIVETLDDAGLDAARMPAVLVASHGPFTWGRDATHAAENAVALELVAGIAERTIIINPDIGPIGERLLDRHYGRKHGPDATYGQGR
ncbi:MAG TPA: L-ribulose-5-phosphate 4-epimerase AraD [Candidatus Limnocylindrales bacterium]